MASIMIRNLDHEVKTRLRMRATGNGRSMEEDARLILGDAVGRARESRNLASINRGHSGPSRGVELALPARGTADEPPSFD